MKALWNNYKEFILYLFFGGCTTLVNMIVYYIFSHLLATGTLPSTWITWVASVLFAYITNKIWVFESNRSTSADIFREALSFFACRAASGVLDILNMWLFVEIFHFNDLMIKIFSNIIAIILNYIASKFLIFKSNSRTQI